ncbi:MAG TPA: hypothetical protein VGX70_07485 [Gemmataceae bacterium]|jgi:hypothetical protein|nr:hypothetical protein [Gemmataceae bacterium]
MPTTDGRMPTTDGEHLCTSILTNVGELRSWMKRVLDDPNVSRPTFRDLCGLSEELLSAATQLTALAIQVTQAAQILHNNGK